MPGVSRTSLNKPATHVRPSKIICGRNHLVPRDKNVVLRQFIVRVNALNSKYEFQRVINILLQEINGIPDPGSSTNCSELFTPPPQVLSPETVRIG